MTKKGEGVVVQQGPHKTLQEKSAKPVGISDEDQKESDLKVASTAQSCLTDEVVYIVMDKKIATTL